MPYNVPNQSFEKWIWFVSLRRLWNIQGEITENYGGIEGSTILRLRNVWSTRFKAAALNHSHEWERFATHSSGFPGNV